jgi:hypothetical protein
LAFQIEHDLFEEAFGDVVAAGEFADGDGAASVVFDKGEQGAQGIISFLRDAHVSLQF